MTQFTFVSRSPVVIPAAVLSGALLLASAAPPQKIELSLVAEKTVSQLPPEPLSERIDDFSHSPRRRPSQDNVTLGRGHQRGLAVYAPPTRQILARRQQAYRDRPKST